MIRKASCSLVAAIESRQTSCLGCDSFSSNRGCAGVVRLCPSCPGSLVATALMLRSHPSTDLQMMASRPSYMWQQTHLDIHIRLILSDLACHGWESGTQPHPRAFSKLFHCPDLPQTHSLTTFSPLPLFFFFLPAFLPLLSSAVPHSCLWLRATCRSLLLRSSSTGYSYLHQIT